MDQMRTFLVRRQRTLRVALMLGFALAAGSGAFAAEAGNNLPVGRSFDDTRHVAHGAGRLRHLCGRNRGARSDAGFRRRRDGRDDEAAAARWHCRLLRGLCRTGDDLIYRPGGGDRPYRSLPIQSQPSRSSPEADTQNLSGMVDAQPSSLSKETP